MSLTVPRPHDSITESSPNLTVPFSGSKFIRRSRLLVMCEPAPVSITQLCGSGVLCVVLREVEVLTGSDISSFPILAELTALFSFFLRLSALSLWHSFQEWPSLCAEG